MKVFVAGGTGALGHRVVRDLVAAGHEVSATARRDDWVAYMKGLGAEPQDCLFVGDSTCDMEAARRAGVRACAVTYGYGEHHQLAEWQPDFWISDLRELLSD